MPQQEHSSRKRILFAFLSIFISVTGMVILSEIVLRFLPVQSATNRIDVNSSQEIAKFQANTIITYSAGWNFKQVLKHRINNDGFANRKDYFLNSKPTIAVVGDSYVQAFQVPQEMSFHGLLQDALINKCNVYSFGISGAPLSQYIAWAKYAKRKYRPSVFVFNVVGNDFDESYRGYKNQPGYWHYQGSPDQEFEYILTPNNASLFKRIGRHSALGRYLYGNVKIVDRLRVFFANFSKAGMQEEFVGNKETEFDDEKLIISQKVVDRFFEDIVSEIQLPARSIIFTVDGLRQTVYGEMPGNVSEQSYVGVLRRYFIQKAESLGFPTIDLHNSFDENYRKDRKRFEFPYDWHWNEHGHSIVFNELLRLDWNLCSDLAVNSVKVVHTG